MIVFHRGGSAQQRLNVQETESPLHLATRVHCIWQLEDGGDFQQEFPWHLGQKTVFKINVKLERDSEWRSLVKFDCEERRDASRN